MLGGFFGVALPEKGLVIQGWGELTGKLSLRAPVIGLAPCIPTATLSDVFVRSLVRDVYRVRNEPINTAQMLGVLEDNDVNE